MKEMPMTTEEVRALDKWASTDPNRMTRDEALAEIRRGHGPPYRMTIEFPPPVLTEEEEAAELAQAEYEDDMGIERDPETYTILRAQNAEDAKREAEDRWRRRPQDDAIGYDIWHAGWCGVYSFRVKKDRAGEV
jgi:hypothetical protein